MRALDLYCKAGGISRGLADIGFEVVGVDVEPQPNYPFEFVQADALTFLDEGGAAGFDFAHASPPCQRWTAYGRRNGVRNEVKPDLIGATRDRLRAIGIPYTLENVPGAPLEDPIRICGTSFPELDVQRHRLFESNLPIVGTDCNHHHRQPRYPGATNRRPNSRRTVEIGVYRIPLEVQRRAMGIDWMTLQELSEAIPPAYARHIGRQVLMYLAHLR